MKSVSISQALIEPLSTGSQWEYSNVTCLSESCFITRKHKLRSH